MLQISPGMRRHKIKLLLAVAIAVVLAFGLAPPLAQPVGYHAFADRRSFLGTPCFLDIVSNLPFLAVGLAGLHWLRGAYPRAPGLIERAEFWPYAVFFLGVALVGIGSSYYHWAPDNARLAWDRLPMTVAFTGLTAAMIAERVSVALGVKLLPLFVAAGIGSVVYWRLSALAGAEDLSPYLAVQGGAILAVLLLLALFPPRYTHGSWIAGVLGAYALAKLFEAADAGIYALGELVSGHTLKHLAAGFAAWLVLAMLQRRRPWVSQGIRA